MSLQKPFQTRADIIRRSTVFGAALGGEFLPAFYEATNEREGRPKNESVMFHRVVTSPILASLGAAFGLAAGVSFAVCDRHHQLRADVDAYLVNPQGLHPMTWEGFKQRALAESRTVSVQQPAAKL